MELGDFISFYVDRGYTRSRTHVKRVRRMYFDDKNGVPLNGLRKWWRGRLPSVWVTAFADLQALTEHLPERRRGAAVYDAFGLISAELRQVLRQSLKISEGCSPRRSASGHATTS